MDSMGRATEKQELGETTHEVYEILGSRLCCACVDPKRISKDLRTKPRARPVSYGETTNQTTMDFSSEPSEARGSGRTF